MKFYHVMGVGAALLCFAITDQAKMVEFAEDAYTAQAPEKIVAVAQEAAELVGFVGQYEVAVPKKAGIAINPWNKFAGHGRNPFTQNLFILINPQWFTNLPSSQQLFLVSRAFMDFAEGPRLWSWKLMSAVPYMFILLCGVMGALGFVVWKRLLAGYPAWMYLLLSVVLVVVLNFIVMNRVQTAILRYFRGIVSQEVIQLTVQKTGNRKAAIGALDALDKAVKGEVRRGESFFEPYSSVFENYARMLEKSS